MIPRSVRALCALCVLCSAAASAQVPAGRSDSAHKADTVAAKPAELPTVKVSGRVVSVPRRYEAAYQRAATGRGYYFTREEIEVVNPHDLNALLYRLPTVQVNDRGVSFAKCQSNLPSPGMSVAPAKVQVYVDDHRSTLDPGAIYQLLASIPPSTVQLMEVYTGVSRIPAEFVNDACAVIVIWTKSY